MNEHDSERIAGMLISLGATEVKSVEDSDIAIFVTCCVRESAETKLFGNVSSCKNIPLRPDSRFKRRIIALGGCIGQRDGNSLIDEYDFISVVFGTGNIDMLPSLLEQAISENRRVGNNEDIGTFSSDLPTRRETPWSAWLPIMTGCNNFCTYCIVPYVRGREKSRNISDIKHEAEEYVNEGVKEIVLLGQNVNSYGRGLSDGSTFANVLRAVDSTGIERLRFVTSHPKDLSDEVIELMGTLSSVTPSLHLPFQSGSDAVLNAMNRKYTAEHYLKLIDKLKQAVPGIALSTDIIVGFPGETEDDFQATCSIVEEVGFAQAFTFIYSPRSGTPAASIAMNVGRDVIQDRFDRLVELVQRNAYEYNRQFLNRTVDVLVDGTSKRDASLISGKSEFNQTVHAPIPQGKRLEDILGEIIKIKVSETKTWYLTGEAI